KTALLHYHLRPGGVTTVVLRQARALLEAGDEVVVFSGEGPASPGWADIPVTVIPELHYDAWRPAAGQDLADALSRALGRDAGVVVVHNPLIRKNSALLGALAELGGRGEKLLLQNHDLAEDFRPDVYSGGGYPENCHYAVINSRDYGFLLESGLTEAGLHLIPNEVSPISFDPGHERRRYLYPVRGIRRKNLGEALLLSLFIPPGRTVAITQPPTTDKDSRVYRRWKDLALELELPVEFEVGLREEFSRVLGSAFAVITCSIKEGFGFSFLEPWTAGLAVTGRRIDYVCRDFEKNGIRFDGFYDSLALPVCGATKDYPRRFREKLERAARGLYAAFGMDPPEQAEGPQSGDGIPDFGAMDEELQEDFIRAAAGDSGLRNAAGELNPFLRTLPEWEPGPALVAANRAAVLAAYSRERLVRILRESCRKAQRPVTQSISPGVLLKRFLDPSRFFLVGIAND
ncbi:MAG: glycosyltransferase family 1 protein, partial [Treponema sp.]|nr:glycosyltransferase family 1 protein [Treponema sp.]